MLKGLIRIGLIVIELDLAGIPSDQPGCELVVPTGEIEMREFCTIIHPVEIIMLIGPCGKVAVYGSEIGKRKNIPSLFYINLDVGLIAAEGFQVYDHIVEQMGIDQPVVRHLESSDQFMQADRISRLEGQFPQDDIVLCLFVPRYIDLSHNIGFGDRVMAPCCDKRRFTDLY